MYRAFRSRRRGAVIFKYIGLGLVVFLTGCVSPSYHYYSGGQRPETELASIKPWKAPFGQNLDVFPIFIDGTPTKVYTVSLPTYFILPGEHTVKVALQGLLAGGGRIRFKDPDKMMFRATAGQTLITKASVKKVPVQGGDGEITLQVSFWLEDDETGAVIAGTNQDAASNAFVEQDEPKLSALVPGTSTDKRLQRDITQRLFVEASKYHIGCEHRVSKAETYKATDPSVISERMGEESVERAKILRAGNEMLLEKWFVESCGSVDVYEVLLLRSEAETDIVVLKL
jgi:hypothetical protein